MIVDMHQILLSCPVHHHSHVLVNHFFHVLVNQTLHLAQVQKKQKIPSSAETKQSNITSHVQMKTLFIIYRKVIKLECILKAVKSS